MLLHNVWHLFEEKVFSVPSTDTLFNPYRDRHPEHDQPDAPAIRRDNLRRYLACYEQRPALFLLLEAPGPWGCRFSGIPITSEAQLLDERFPISGRRSSRQEDPHTEYSAGIYWRVVQPYFPQIFTWNSVPYHPHHPEDPLSIRTPKSSEVKAYGELLDALLDAVRPEQVLAIGRKAEYALQQIDRDCTYVRHPSHGGAKKFEAGVCAAVKAHGLDDEV